MPANPLRPDDARSNRWNGAEGKACNINLQLFVVTGVGGGVGRLGLGAPLDRLRRMGGLGDVSEVCAG